MELTHASNFYSCCHWSWISYNTVPQHILVIWFWAWVPVCVELRMFSTCVCVFPLGSLVFSSQKYADMWIGCAQLPCDRLVSSPWCIPASFIHISLKFDSSYELIRITRDALIQYWYRGQYWLEIFESDPLMYVRLWKYVVLTAMTLLVCLKPCHSHACDALNNLEVGTYWKNGIDASLFPSANQLIQAYFCAFLYLYLFYCILHPLGKGLLNPATSTLNSIKTYYLGLFFIIKQNVWFFDKSGLHCLMWQRFPWKWKN